MASMEVNTFSDDETHLKAPNMLEIAKNLHAASKLFGKDMSSVSSWKERMEKAGFINVKEEVYKVCRGGFLILLRKMLTFYSSLKAHGPRIQSSESSESSTN
jgi:hypothetical protein